MECAFIYSSHIKFKMKLGAIFHNPNWRYIPGAESQVLFLNIPCNKKWNQKYSHIDKMRKIIYFTHLTNTKHTLLNARGQTDRKGAWGSFVHSEFRSWPLNKLALLRWAALTMMYGRNTIHCCYELVGSMRTMPAHTRTCTKRHAGDHKQVHRHRHTYRFKW